MGSLSVAETKDTAKSRDDLGARRIAKVLPAEYSAFEKALSGDIGVGDARAVIRLISKAKELRANISPSLETLKNTYMKMPRSEAEAARQRLWDATNAYRVSWLLCLQMFKNSKSEEARQLILGEWDKSLREDDEYLPSQLICLVVEGDREFLTNELWRLLQQSKKKRTVSAICCAIWARGNRADEGRLEKVRETFVNDKRGEFAELVAQAIRAMDYRLYVKAHPEFEENGGPVCGPACKPAPPPMEEY
jgi:hypothetical protein